ncbi:MAG: hypothetical protein RL017_825 [Pseudomonadota bacterium]|jgi:hypothetical protein
MKKILLLVATLATTTAFANHSFSVCYHNLTNETIMYNNSDINHNWANPGELVGEGKVAPNETKCFKNITDETMFSADYITFTIYKSEGENQFNRWVGIVNPGFTKPYVIAQDSVSTDKKEAKLKDHNNSGRDRYMLHIFINQDGKFTYSNNDDPKNPDGLITPYKFK